ncbi:MAG: 2-C-methyl-D-erythritol 4-phosphate cytidylyltransferase, partial [Bacteroidales bacterium]|nr:2-C-methyl-D-erythritol 4-phosphate cytidylyltransferase [Bacteroidales bacterium]
MNVAIILAGGSGNRFGKIRPKQFVKVAGKTILEHSVAVFEAHLAIDEIAVVIHQSFVSEMEAMVLSNGWKKVKKILIGGKERYESSLVAIEAYGEYPDSRLLFHDAVRPLVSRRIIDEVVAALSKYNAVNVAIPTTDTIIQVDDSGTFVASTLNRHALRRVQTPQGFRQATIATAYKNGLTDDNFSPTDDCGVVLKYLPTEPIFIVCG